MHLQALIVYLVFGKIKHLGRSQSRMYCDHLHAIRHGAGPFRRYNHFGEVVEGSQPEHANLSLGELGLTVLARYGVRLGEIC